MNDEIKRNHEGYYDPTPYRAIRNYESSGTRMEVYRGDIFYVKKSGFAVGSEQEAGRPAVIVSNNSGNHFSQIVEVVWLTTQEKKELPVHTEVLCKVKCTALCEQITSVSKERLSNYVRSCTAEEMAAIDRCLMISLGLEQTAPVEPKHNEQIDNLTMKLEGAERALDDADRRFEQMKADRDYLQSVVNELHKGEPKAEPKEEAVKLMFERDFYKQQYEMLLGRMIG